MSSVATASMVHTTGAAARTAAPFVARPTAPPTPPSIVTTPPGDVGAYYALAQGKQGAALVHALAGIIRNGHTDQGYSHARDVLFGTIEDPSNSNTVTDIYTGHAITGVADRGTAFQQGLNTEHTWPQSQGARGIAQSDLHQLQPADIKINGLRGNLPYGEVTSPSWTSGGADRDHESELGTDTAGHTVFQPPAAVRGNIARGLLYFYTRYNESRPADFTLDAFRQELPTLLKWAKDDPVDDAERARNEAIFRVQHNRNPYVDHPEWIDAADFAHLKV